MDSQTQTVIVQQIAAHQSRLRGFVRCLLVASSDVDDLVQEINTTLWEKAEQFKVGTDFWAWASQIARFKVLNHLRKSRRQPALLDDATLARLADVAERRVEELDQRREALQQCLAQLPAGQRQLIQQRYFSGLGVEAISESVHRSAASVSQTLYRIRGSLLKCIDRRIEANGGVK